MNHKMTRKRAWVLVSPALLFVVFFFVTGLASGVLESIGLGMNGGGLPNLSYYREVLSGDAFWVSMRFSFKIAGVSSFLSVLIGYGIAFLLSHMKESGPFIAIQHIPVLVPHLVAILLVQTVLSQSGLVARIAFFLGFISDPSQFPALLYDKSGWGIILVYLWKGAPYVAVTLYDILKRIRAKWEPVARNLGADPARMFWTVTLPLSAAPASVAFLILFAFSFGAYETPFLLGATTPKALPVEAYLAYTNANLGSRAISMVYNVLIALIAGGFAILYHRLTRKEEEDR